MEVVGQGLVWKDAYILSQGSHYKDQMSEDIIFCGETTKFWNKDDWAFGEINRSFLCGLLENGGNIQTK